MRVTQEIRAAGRFHRRQFVDRVLENQQVNLALTTKVILRDELGSLPSQCETLKFHKESLFDAVLAGRCDRVSLNGKRYCSMYDP